MTNNPPPPDVGAILAALRHEVRARRLAQSPDPSTSALDQQLARCAEQLEITRVVSAHWPLESRTPLARAQNLVNKVVRRALRWYINPIVEQQNAFNDVAARTLRLLVDAYGELRIENVECRIEKEAVQNNELDSGGDNPSASEPAASSTPQNTAISGLPASAALPDNAAFLNSQFSILNLQHVVGELAEAESPAPLADLLLPPLALAIADRAPVHAHWELGQGAGPVVQRLVRRYLRWLVNPIVEQQNAFNAALAAIIPSLTRLDADARARVATRRWQRRRETRDAGSGDARRETRDARRETESSREGKTKAQL